MAFLLKVVGGIGLAPEPVERGVMGWGIAWIDEVYEGWGRCAGDNARRGDGEINRLDFENTAQERVREKVVPSR